MQSLIKQSTEVKVVIGPVVAVGDGFTPITTLNLGTADEAEIVKHDAAAVTDISGATFAALANADGYYLLTLTTSLSDTLGMLTVLINDDSLCLPVKAAFMVATANVWDTLYSTDKLEVDVTLITGAAEWLTTAIPSVAPDSAGGLLVGGSVITSIDEIVGALYSEGTQALDQTNTLQEIVDAVLDEAIASHVAAGSVGLRITRVPDAAAGANGGLPTVNASNYIVGMQGTLNTLDDMPTDATMADAVLDELVTSHVVANSVGAALGEKYWAKFEVIGGSTTDKYRAIRFFKGDEEITSGITVPTIQVVETENGTDLIGATALTPLASSDHIFKHDATGADLTTVGVAYLVRLAATIDGGPEEFAGTFVRT